jgi:hypothetical protein
VWSFVDKTRLGIRRIASRGGTCDKRVLPYSKESKDVRLQYLTRNIGPFECSVAWRDDQERPLRRTLRPVHGWPPWLHGFMASMHDTWLLMAAPGASSSFTLNVVTSARVEQLSDVRKLDKSQSSCLD